MPNPRKPDAIKKLQGTFRPDRANPEAPEPEAVRIPSAPKHLAEDERQVWSAFRKFMQPLNVVASVDLYGFEQMVRWVARMNRLWADPQASVRDLDTCNKNMKGWVASFGMTPSDRAKVRALVGEEVAQTLEDFLN